jgi:hypothetical protein
MVDKLAKIDSSKVYWITISGVEATIIYIIIYKYIHIYVLGIHQHIHIIVVYPLSS